MPNRDHRGPEGQGPMTGRGLGDCRDKKKPPRQEGRGLARGHGRNQSGRGLGKRRGRGFGRRQ
ncbi:MAG: DUF5320 domain-containing protein [Bacillota bacterium]